MPTSTRPSSYQLGATNLGPFGIGLSLFSPWASVYGTVPSEEEDERNILTVISAVQGGVVLLDSATYYGVDGHGLKLLAKILKRVPRDRVVISVKFGAKHVGKGMVHDMSAENVRKEIDLALDVLQTPYVDIFTPARADPSTPIRDTVAELGKLVAEGKVRHIGLSEVTPALIREAASVHPIACLQTEYGPLERSIETNGIFDACKENDILVLAYGVVQHGFVSSKGLGRWEDFRDEGARTFYPRFHRENYEHNQQYLRQMQSFLARKQLPMTISQLAIAYVMRRASAPRTMPLLGVKSMASVQDNLAVVEIAANRLGDADLVELSELIASFDVRGDRYPPHVMKGITG